jgi:aspartyl-tRNA(Asn)/glutamyl-tRNA(Gln) amidotransferase subunit A
MDKPLHELSIAEAGRALRNGSISSVRLTEHALARIAAIDPQISSFLTVTADRALADAAAADRDFASGIDRGPMQGVPHALKDIYDTAGVRTTCHSKLRENIVPAKDSAVAEKFAKQGAVLLGKLATHEFALGGPSFDLPFPPARNPWNRDHAPGGSSSGSGAAVAAGLVRMAMGSDTGGSIRGPAAYCGTVGLKPTYGLVSRVGVFPLSWTLDHCGPLAWSVEDAAIALGVVAGYDPHDAASADRPKEDYVAQLQRGVQGLRVGVIRQFYERDASPEVIRAIDDAAQTLARLGAVVENVALPDYALFNACGRVIMYTEAFTVHERDFRERALDFGKLTYLRMSMGAFVTGADLGHAMRLRRELAKRANAALRRYDVFITASAVGPAPPFVGAPQQTPSAAPIQAMPWNVTGNPAMSIPTGFSKSGLPLSMQIVGKYFDEATVLRVGAAFESETKLNLRRPALAA